MKAHHSQHLRSVPLDPKAELLGYANFLATGAGRLDGADDEQGYHDQDAGDDGE